MKKYTADIIDTGTLYYDADEADKFLDNKTQQVVALVKQNEALNTRVSEQNDTIINDGKLIHDLKAKNDELTLDIESKQLTILKFIGSLTKTLKKFCGNGHNK